MERYVYSFGGSFVIAVLLTALLFAIKAVAPGLEDRTEGRFGHAWAYMGVLAIVVFVAIGMTPFRLASSARSLAVAIAAATVASGTVIVAVSAFVAATE